MTPLRRTLGEGLPEFMEAAGAWMRECPFETDRAQDNARQFEVAAEEVRLMMARIAQLERDLEEGAAHEP